MTTQRAELISPRTSAGCFSMDSDRPENSNHAGKCTMVPSRSEKMARTREAGRCKSAADMVARSRSGADGGGVAATIVESLRSHPRRHPRTQKERVTIATTTRPPPLHACETYTRSLILNPSLTHPCGHIGRDYSPTAHRSTTSLQWSACDPRTRVVHVRAGKWSRDDA